MSVHTSHHDWADSMADWAEHQHFERERMELMTQGYGKRERQENIDLAHHFVDAMPEPYSQGDDQVESADGVFWIYMATIGAVIAAAVVAVWA